MKTCPKCKIEKLESEFYKETRTRDGLHWMCKACDKARCNNAYRTNSVRRQSSKRSNKQAWDRLKAAAIEHYGGYICVCCSETTPEFLSLDHINNDGAKQRRELNNGHFYRWLRDNEYPVGIQVLCMNCNFGKRMNSGVCPHQSGVMV